MKATVITLLIGVSVLLSFAGCAFTSRVKEISEIAHFSFSYTCSDMAYGYESYSLDCEEGIYTLTVKKNGVPEEEAVVLQTDKEFAEMLQQFLNENDVGKWNGFDKSDKHVTDGDRFNLYIVCEDGITVDAHGYMKWPQNYSEVKQGIVNMFDELVEGK